MSDRHGTGPDPTSERDIDGGPGLGPLGVIVVALGLIAVTMLAKIAYITVLNDPQTAPSDDNPMVVYRTDAEREHEDQVAATQVSAARFAVALGIAERQPGATRRDVLRAARNGTIPVPQVHVVETRLGWVRLADDGFALCVESDVTAAFFGDNDVMLRETCDAT